MTAKMKHLKSIKRVGLYNSEKYELTGTQLKMPTFMLIQNNNYNALSVE